MPRWLKEEEELFKKAWESGDYDVPSLCEIFQRNITALRKKAESLGLKSQTEIDALARLKSIREALKEYTI